MWNPALSGAGGGQLQLPLAELQLREGVCVPVPFIEVTHQPHFLLGTVQK